MRFSVTYNDGYVVSVRQMDTGGYIRYKPLRKFHEQGDAFCFRECDCPKLSDIQIKMLIKQYSPSKKYKRISSKRFVDYDEYVDNLYQQELSML